MKSDDIILQAALNEFERRLPSLKKHRLNTIDKLVRDVSQKHKIHHRALKDIFTDKHVPDRYHQNKLDEQIDPETASEIMKFAQWAGDRLHIKQLPEIELSMDTDEAHDGKATGCFWPSEGKVWVYCKNRNLIDIFRSIFHELVHVRQNEIGMIDPNGSGQSYPGAPIETMAEMLAGKYIKIWKDNNPNCIQ